MLRETMDSTYVYIINRSSKSNYKERFKYNNIYQPWGYNPSDKLKAIKSKNKKYNYKYELIGDYDARLLKDTICIFSDKFIDFGINLEEKLVEDWTIHI